MSHAAAEACTQRLAAGRGDGYRLAAATADSSGTAEQWTRGLATKPLVNLRIHNNSSLTRIQNAVLKKASKRITNRIVREKYQANQSALW